MNHQRLKCYQMSMFVTKAMPELIASWPKGYGYLSDQLKRASASIGLNIAEGNGKISKPDRKRHFTISMASASEVSAILEIAHIYQLIDKPKYDYLQDLILQVYKMLYKLQ